jgi:hypothetical protein
MPSGFGRFFSRTVSSYDPPPRVEFDTAFDRGVFCWLANKGFCVAIGCSSATIVGSGAGVGLNEVTFSVGRLDSAVMIRFRLGRSRLTKLENDERRDQEHEQGRHRIDDRRKRKYAATTLRLAFGDLCHHPALEICRRLDMFETGNEAADSLLVFIEQFLLTVDFPIHSFHK